MGGYSEGVERSITDGETMTKILRMSGNVMAVAAVLSAAGLSLVGVYIVANAYKPCAWLAVVTCLIWFCSLAIRSLTKEKNHAA